MKEMTETKPAAGYLNAHVWTKRFNIFIFLLLIILNIFVNFVYEERLTEDVITNNNGNKEIMVPTSSTESKSKPKSKSKSKSKSINTTVTIIEGPNIMYDHDEEIILDDRDKDINKEYCGEERCRFLFAYHPTEQETQANMHFMSFAQLAKRLNRTLVLTNVGNSRIQACKRHPFGFYFDVEEFRRRFPDVRMITQSDFQRWTILRERKPETYWGFIQPRNTSFLVEYLGPYDELLRKKECMWQFEFVLNHRTVFKKIFLGVNYLWTQSELDIAVTKFMLQQLNTTKEVLLLEHRLPKLLFNDPRDVPPIPYTKQLVDSTTNASNSIRPYVGIHWRMEQGDVKKMPECANQLVNYLKRLKRRTGIENVYFATDYPLLKLENGSKPHKAQSSTFHKLFPEHHKAFRIMMDYLGKGDHMHTWVSTDILGYLPTDEGLVDEFKGSGVQGIADKLMLVNSAWFVSGPKGCARTSSTFTRRIREFRARMVASGNKKLLNIHERWR